MFEIGWSELLLVGSVALIVIGPKELPTVLRTVGRTVTKVRRMAGDFQSQFQDALREADMQDVAKDISSIAQTARNTASPKALFDPLNNIRDEIRSTVAGAGAAVASIPAAVEASAQTSADTQAAESKVADATVETPENAALQDMRDEIRKAMGGRETAGNQTIASATGQEVDAFATLPVSDALEDLLPPPPASPVEMVPLDPPVAEEPAPILKAAPDPNMDRPAEDNLSDHPKAS